MRNVQLRPTTDDTPIPANTYQFGLKPYVIGQAAIIDTWVNTNLFTNVANGRYYWAVRRIDNHNIVNDGIFFISDVDPSDLAVNMALNERLDGILLNLTQKGQTVFNIGNDEKRRILWINGIKQRIGVDYTINLPTLTWIGNIVLEPGKHSVELVL